MLGVLFTIVKMADDKVEVVVCTSLISASPGAAVVISDGRRESENIKHRLTRTFATEISLVHLTRFCRSCVLVKELKTYHQHKTHCYSMYGVPLIKGVIFGVSLCSCNLNYQVPVTGAGVQLITVGILCGRQYLMQLNVAQS